MSSSSGWIGVDLDGTLAKYPGTYGKPHDIGEPIPLMVNRVKAWIKEGREVRIVTARAAGPFTDVLGRDIGEEAALKEVRDWCEKHIGQQLPITCRKDYMMVELWDDRAKQVLPNTGLLLEDILSSEMDKHTKTLELLVGICEEKYPLDGQYGQ